jgi:hypothetical protein
MGPMSSRVASTAVACLVLFGLSLAGTGVARQEVAPSFTARPVLVKSAGGAFLHYQLDRRAVRTHVTIAGRTARIRHEGGAADDVYDAFVSDAGMRAGKEYAVHVSVVSASGGTATRDERLLLHARFPAS